MQAAVLFACRYCVIDLHAIDAPTSTLLTRPPMPSTRDDLHAIDATPA